MSCTLDVCRRQENGHTVMVYQIQSSQVCLNGVRTHISLIHPILSGELPISGENGSIGGIGH